jgi:hypothetical protein
MFFERASEEAERLRALMARGVLPKDVRFAMSSVGVIPYVTGAATIDRLGLTDAHVAHGPFSTRLMAHGKHATMDYARARDVDLWFYDPVYAHLPLLSRRLLKGMIDSRHFQDDVWAAEVAPDTFLVCKLPQGVDAAARRMPRVLFRSFRDSSFAHLVLERSIEAQQEVVRWAPGEPEPLGKLALMLLENQRYPEAAGLYHSILQRFPDDPETLDPYAACQLALKDYSGAARTVGHQLEVLRRNGRTHDAVAVERNLRAIESIVPAVVTGGGAPSVAIGRSTSSLKGSRRR